MSIVEDLVSRAQLLRDDVLRLTDEIEGFEQEIAKRREKIAVLELQSVESMTAANILREMGLRVSRTDEGLPHVAVDRTLERADGP